VSVASPDLGVTEKCPCGRMGKSPWTWLCRICHLEKEIGYALSELERDGEAWAGRSWHEFGVERLRKLIS